MRLKYNMVNPAYRLMIGMIVLLSGVGVRSVQAQYAPAMAQPGAQESLYQATAYHGGHKGNLVYEPAPDYYASPDQYASEYYAPDYYGDAANSGSIMQVLPEDRGWGYDHPWDGFFKNLAENSWLRVEYMLVKSPPGNQLVGGDLPSGNDPRQPFPAADANGFLTLSSKEADLSSIGKKGTNGIRGTFGIDFERGTLEAIFFGTQSDVSSVSYGQAELMGPNFGQTDMISIITRLDGQTAIAGRNFNEKFSVVYRSQAWGAESNYVVNTDRLLFKTVYGAGGFQMRPLFGFRYLKIAEDMDIRGSFEELTTTPTVPLFESTVQSATNNKLYVPQAGIRMEFVHPWFTISAEPKVGFGVNHYKGSVMTDQFLDSTDPTHFTAISKTNFSPTFEFGVNARFHLNQWFTFNVGYNFLWANQIARPGTIVYYNTNSTTTNGVSLQAQNSLDSYKLHGLVLGGEISWP